MKKADKHNKQTKFDKCQTTTKKSDLKKREPKASSRLKMNSQLFEKVKDNFYHLLIFSYIRLS